MSGSALVRVGALGPILLASVTVFAGATRPGYSPVRDLISNLALTSHGWVQIANFVISGGLLLVLAAGLRRSFPQGPAARWGPRWVALTGAALIAAGVFVTDPGPHYPSPAPATTTWHGAVHSVVGPLVFLGLAASCFVYARRFARAVGVAAGVSVLLLFVGAGVLTSLDYAGVWTAPPAGALESGAMYLGLAWLLFVARTAVHHRGPT